MKVACIQSNVVFGDSTANAAVASGHLDRLAADGVEVAVFPEAFLTGYCVETLDQAQAIAIPRGHSSLETVQMKSEETGILTIIGFAEAGSEGLIYNTAAIFDPGKPAQFYRKVHLPELGLDNFVTTGNELPVFDTSKGKIGVIICFDLRIPEATRTLALKGAELIVLPTNWPTGADISADHNTITRAGENRVFLAACNRSGTENGFSFIGKSKILGPNGRILALAGVGEEAIIADIDPAEARIKKTVTIPGKFEIELFATRKPQLYKEITEQ